MDRIFFILDILRILLKKNFVLCVFCGENFLCFPSRVTLPVR